jgi:hypothetical protein
MLSTADDSNYCWYLPHIEDIECGECCFTFRSANSARYGTKIRIKFMLVLRVYCHTNISYP